MKQIIFIFAALMIITGITGCYGPIVEVPTAHVGKLKDSNGLVQGIIGPSKFRLEWVGSYAVGNSLIICEASDYPASEKMQIFIPKDKLNLIVDVRGTFSISSNQQNVDKIFARITPRQTTEANGRVSTVSMQQVYNTYAQPVIREVVRSFMSAYTIEEIMFNREEIGKILAAKIQEKLKNTPISAIYFGLADIQPPSVIVAAQESAKERKIQIDRAEADKLVKLKEAEAALEVAKKQQEVDLKEAETQVLVNKKLAEGVNQAFVMQRALRSLDALAANPNTVFFLPYEAMSNPNILLGVMNKTKLQGQK